MTLVMPVYYREDEEKPLIYTTYAVRLTAFRWACICFVFYKRENEI